jgi:hypothetical protein
VSAVQNHGVGLNRGTSVWGAAYPNHLFGAGKTIDSRSQAKLQNYCKLALEVLEKVHCASCWIRLQIFAKKKRLEAEHN